MVVGIGASAGGLDALQRFVAAIPADCPLSFVVVMHLQRGVPSRLVEILADKARIPVMAARDGAPVEPGTIYVRPPDGILTIHEGRLRLAPAKAHGGERPIDALLMSLAEAYDDAAVGILMSGAGDDGCAGMATIQRRGGLTMVQGGDDTGPLFAEMPQAAQSLGIVDLTLPAATMPDTLMELTRNWAEPLQPRIAAPLKSIHELMRQRTGHDFSMYKDRTFLRRVHRRMRLSRTDDLRGYLARLRKEPEEVSALFHDLLISVTEFFRDPEAFEVLGRQVIPKLFENKGAAEELRVWVPACATGEEAYSIAMLLREHMDTMTAPPRVQVFATDIDERALGVARAGRYAAAALRQMPQERVRRHFTIDGDTCRINREVRDLCIFSVHSVIRDPPFSRLELVSCRNLLIYLGAELQGEVIQTFHYALQPGGYLFLGPSENLSRHAGLFVAVDSSLRIFRRHDQALPRAQTVLPLAMRRGALDPRSVPAPVAPVRDKLLLRSQEIVLERFAPAYVVVDEAGEAIEYSAHTGRFLEMPAGPPSRNLVALARRELKPVLRTLLTAARQTQKPQTSEDVSLRGDDRGKAVRIAVEPIVQQEARFFQVVFSDVEPAAAAAGAAASAATAATHPSPAEDVYLHQLESELKETKEQMQSLVEELETSNEELRSSNEELLSMNEELQSSNEELQTSKQELQSVNEELHTVNDELHRKVDELDRANDDLRNIFDSTHVATIFLDRDMRIRSFTPAVTAIFKLLAGDRGRPLTDIAHHLSGGSIAADVKAVLETGCTVERRVDDPDTARHYLMRILPYHTAGGVADGALLMFVDVGTLTQAEERQRLLAEELAHRGKNLLTVVGSIASQTLKRATSVDEFGEAFEGRLHALALAQDFLSSGELGEAPLSGIIRAVLTPYVGAGLQRQVVLRGPPVPLTSRAALTLGLAMHELATNAAKYGALSRPDGRVSVSWDFHGRGRHRSVHIRWRESGGPVLGKRPPKTGFGTELVARSIEYELRGKVKLQFARSGLDCEIVIPAAAVFAGGLPAQTAAAKRVRKAGKSAGGGSSQPAATAGGKTRRRRSS